MKFFTFALCVAVAQAYLVKEKTLGTSSKCVQKPATELDWDSNVPLPWGGETTEETLGKKEGLSRRIQERLAAKKLREEEELGDSHEGLGDSHEGLGDSHEGLGDSHEGLGDSHEGDDEDLDEDFMPNYKCTCNCGVVGEEGELDEELIDAEIDYFKGMFSEGACPMVDGMLNVDAQKMSGDWYTVLYSGESVSDFLQPVCHHVDMQVNEDGTFTSNEEFTMGGKHMTIEGINGIIDGNTILAELEDGKIAVEGILLDTDYENYQIYYQCYDNFGIHDHDLTLEEKKQLKAMPQRLQQLFLDEISGQPKQMKMEKVIVMTSTPEVDDEQIEALKELVAEKLPEFDTETLEAAISDIEPCHYSI